MCRVFKMLMAFSFSTYSYHRFAKCYSRLYKVQPELTKCVYNQFIAHLQTSFREEIQDLKEEGNLSVLFKSLDELAEEAKKRSTPAWRPSGIPEEDIHSAVVPYLLKQRRFLQKAIKEKEEANSRLAEAVLAGRKRIADLQEEIRKSKEEWQVSGASQVACPSVHRDNLLGAHQQPGRRREMYPPPHTCLQTLVRNIQSGGILAE
uniref:Polyamine modulated factor 1 n=1 Tax=Podarcis muralis TaxID=64176 RepID=A0A670JUA2_PODMU